jgi:hypothetical protein
MDRNDPEACLAEQSVIATLGAPTGAVSQKHVQVRSGPGTIAGARSQRQVGQALHHEKAGSAGHRCPAAGKDQFAGHPAAALNAFTDRCCFNHASRRWKRPGTVAFVSAMTAAKSPVKS